MSQLLSAAITIALPAAGLVGCAPQTASPPTTAASSSTSETATTSPTTAAAAGAKSGVSNGETYEVTMVSVTGATPDNLGRWDVNIGQLAGGDAGVRDAFNQASDASGHQQLDQMRAETGPDTQWDFESHSAVTFRPVAIAEVITGVHSAKEAAHPNNYVNTIVIDSRSAKPITLADLFANEQAGLERLSEQTRLIFPKVWGGGPSPMLDEPGNRPIAENFANWIPISQGIELHFFDYQFGHGLPVITVPWSALTDVLAPDMVALEHD
ncbi:DUF3298 domain-containing protein [Mycobacterium pseudoshottsii]|uniref:DUF3298 domain-containing protein n=1 Tax=Mycobacterium pseudoshottsii TaxID=265949 RepID=UPI00165DCBF5|nr:DUF3298 domain-containing protein [Mycobacterium pseudoshottsii]MBC9862270.1 hypothetical protein [Mycobacterium pseudoshottsii]